jgi:hypothetical protein
VLICKKISKNYGQGKPDHNSSRLRVKFNRAPVSREGDFQARELLCCAGLSPRNWRDRNLEDLYSQQDKQPDIKKMGDQSLFPKPMLIGQLDKIRDNFGKPVRILIHQAMACPIELDQPGDVYPLCQNK